MRRVGAVVAVLALLASGAGAAASATSTGSQAPEVSTPDGRVRLRIEAHQTGPNSGWLHADGNVGAYHFDNTAEGSPSGFRLTNPPMFGAVGTGGREFEETFGPPVARAALGTGGITAAVKATGVLTNLNWPGPGLYDHVAYLNRTRGWPNQGAPENAGSFAGLLLPGGTATWFTELDGWRVAEQRYEGTSGVLRTALEHPGLGLGVVLRDVVHPSLDVLARRIQVTSGAPAGTSIVYYANLNPTTTRTPRVPSTTDALVDEASDFATVHLADVGAMLHFRPYRLDPAAATVAATGRLGLENTLAAVSGAYGPGVYIAVGADATPDQFQAGLEAAGLVRGEAEGTPLLDPFYDARDGWLSGSAAAFGKTAGAQAWEGAEQTVYLAASADSLGAVAALAEARRVGFAGIEQAAGDDWQAWLAGVRLPVTLDEQVKAVARRALMLMRTAQDRRTGAITANVTTQTPYRQDWLRDGAFFNYVLLLAGTDRAVEMVRRHNDFYRRAQSETGHWDPILCTDGAHCDAVFPFEIDAQAFGVWALWLEYEFTGDLDRLRLNYEAIRKGAEVLWACQDPTNGLQCRASEDDHAEPTQGAQGASTVYLGLRSAARAARLVGDPADADRWDGRAGDLRAAARARFCGTTCATGRGYMIWPGRLLTADPDPGHPAPEHPALQATLDGIGATLDARAAFTQPQPGGFLQYPMEPMFGLAVAWQALDASTRLGDAVRWLAHDVAEPGVDHFGERIFHLGAGRYLHSIGFPHIWSGAETYIAAALVLGVDGCTAAGAASGTTCPAP